MTCILYFLAVVASTIAFVFVLAACKLSKDVADHERNH